MEHVPAETGWTAPLTIVQIPVLLETKVTARPEDALALKDSSASVIDMFAGCVKVMLWVLREIVNVRVTESAAV